MRLRVDYDAVSCLCVCWQFPNHKPGIFKLFEHGKLSHSSLLIELVVTMLSLHLHRIDLRWKEAFSYTQCIGNGMASYVKTIAYSSTDYQQRYLLDTVSYYRTSCIP